MTREDVLKLQTYKLFEHDKEVYVSRDDVLKALQTEPCDYAISRQAVLDLCDSTDPEYRVVHFKEDVECLPSVQPEQFINKPCVSEQACREDKMNVLDKIRKEIEAKCCITIGRENDGAVTLHDVFEIIDKYKEESEEE